MFYWLLFPASLVALAFVYYWYGPFMAYLSAGFFLGGWIGHKHRAFVRDQATYTGLSLWQKAKGWFGA